MKRIIGLLLGVWPLLGMSLPIRPINQGPFYVSPSGSDSTGDGTSGNPWRQPQHAADFLRTNKINQVQDQDITINLSTGSYAPLALGRLDSGFNGHSVKYVSADGAGKAVIDAGIRITSWSPAYTVGPNQVYVASVPNQFATLYENGVRAHEARFPNWSMSTGFTSTFEPYLISASDTFNIQRLAYNPTDFTGGWDPSTVATPSDLRVVAWCGGFSEWKTTTVNVASVDSVNHFMNFPSTALCKFAVFNQTLGSRYFVEGVKEALDVPGEWYLDRSGLLLYYIPRDGPIASQNIVIPTATQAVTITGVSQKPGDRAENIVIDGLMVKDTDFVDPYYIGGWPVLGQIQYPNPIPWVYPFFAWLASQPQFRLAAVHLVNTQNDTLQNMIIEDAGLNGIDVDGWGTGTTIQHVWIRRVGGAGIRFEGQFPGLGDWVNNNAVYDFRINNMGELSGEGSGFEIAQSGSNTFHYGYVFNGPRKGAWILATTGQNAVLDTIYTRDNLLDHILFQYLDQDSGDSNALGWDSLSSLTPTGVVNTASQIIIDHVQANTSVRDISPFGVYCDDETWGQVMTNVEVTNAQGGLLHVGGSGATLSTPVVTNCSFNNDGTTNGSFNPALMDTANIQVTASFPWPCTTYDATGACTSNPDPN